MDNKVFIITDSVPAEFIEGLQDLGFEVDSPKKYASVLEKELPTTCINILKNRNENENKKLKPSFVLCILNSLNIKIMKINAKRAFMEKGS